MNDFEKPRFPVVIAKGKHLAPFRTQQLSPSAPMVLPWRRGGRVGHRRDLSHQKPPSGRLLRVTQEKRNRAASARDPRKRKAPGAGGNRGLLSVRPAPPPRPSLAQDRCPAAARAIRAERSRADKTAARHPQTRFSRRLSRTTEQRRRRRRSPQSPLRSRRSCLKQRRSRAQMMWEFMEGFGGSGQGIKATDEQEEQGSSWLARKSLISS